MQNSPKLDTVRSYWQTFLGCSDENFDQKKTSIFLHRKDVPEPIDNENEIYVLEYQNGGTVVSVSEKMFDRVSGILESGSDDVERSIRAAMDITQKHGPQLAYYQFKSPVFPVSPNVSVLTQSDLSTYETFMAVCDPKDRKMVCMDIANPFHTFFAYRSDGQILSLGNYVRDDEQDTIAHIGIITLPEAKGKGYATQVIKSLLNDISDKGFIPQWRAHADNDISQKLAEDFGFQEVLRTYSLITI